MKKEGLIHYNTNYGPEENEEADLFYRKKKNDDTQNIKEYLEQQITFKKEVEDLRKSQEFKTA